MKVSTLEVWLVVAYCCAVGYYVQKIVFKYSKTYRIKEKTDIDTLNDKLNRFADKGWNFAYRATMFLVFGFLAFWLYTKVRFW